MASVKSRKNSEPKTALCYVRQSQTRDETDTNSPERQKANIQAVCDQHGWIPEWYEDAEGHKSGRSVKNRPGWLALEKRLRDSDVVALVANDLSRIHRKGWRIGNLLDMVNEYDIRLVLAAPGKQIDFFSPQGRAVAQLSSIFDEWYADDIAQRAMDSVAYRKSRGITVGLPPFGSIRDESGLLKPSAEGAWLMPDGVFVAGTGDEPPAPEAIWRGYYDCSERILRLYAANQDGFERIAYKMQADGWAFRDRNGEPRAINGDDVRRVVSNWAEYGGYVYKLRARERHPLDYDLDEIVLDEEKAIFPVELLYTVGQVRRTRTIRRPVGDKVNLKAYPYPLSGLVRCAYCEQRAADSQDERFRSLLSGKQATSGKRRYRHTSGVQCGCANRSVLAEVIEDEFGRLLELLTVKTDELPMLTNLALQATSFYPSKTYQSDFEARRRSEIARCKRRMDAAQNLYLDGELSREEYLRRKEQNEREIALWQSYSQEIERVSVELAACADAVEKLHQLWKTGEPEDKQGLAQNLFEYLAFDLDTHRITDFRLKPWADRFITLKSALYAAEDESKTPQRGVQDEGNHVTLTGNAPNYLLQTKSPSWNSSSESPVLNWNN